MTTTLAGHAAADGFAQPSASSLKQLGRLASPRVGVIRSLCTAMKSHEDSRLITVCCQLHSLPLGMKSNAFVGHGRTLEEATTAALGEACERYCSFAPLSGEPVLASARELGSEAVEPESFEWFSPDQYDAPGFPFQRFTRSTKVTWSRGYALDSGAPVYLPSQLVYLPGRHFEGEVPVVYSTSNGTACGASLADAILGALLECIERDAFMLTWRSRLSLPRIESSISETTTVDEQYFGPSGARYDVLDLSSFHRVPTCLAIVHSGLSGALGIGAASAARPEDAWRRALREGFASRAWFKHERLNETGPIWPSGAHEVEDFKDHFFFYGDPDRREALRFLSDSEETIGIGDIEPLVESDADAQIVQIVSSLRDHGIDAYYVDLTAAEVATVGLRVVRVVCPQLCAPDTGYGIRFLGNPRLQTAAYECGLRAAPLRFDELNLEPHPLP
jgi:ribosomal protein S12 methylthiotransferase accessory factor